MELFLLFLFSCIVIGMTIGNLNLRRQVWLVVTCVAFMTVLYFINPGLL
ncbi:MAG: hypothetical protein KDE19_02365 [Caldilineaceae bacterium]|nr:hypothetical protein [Caldilineaceae bacterium]